MPLSRTPFAFPDPRTHADEDGIVAFTPAERLPSVALLETAYRQGIFPWPVPGAEVLPWFSPDPRAILELKRLHIPRSLAASRKRAVAQGVSFTIDRDFQGVIDACSEVPRAGQPGTWITPELMSAYVAFHQAGLAHSVEVWDRDLRLIGGLYGVAVRGAFAGESMFHRVTDASKWALLHLLDQLAERGCEWIDIQMLTPHMEALGAHEIPRGSFLDRLQRAQAQRLKLFG